MQLIHPMAGCPWTDVRSPTSHPAEVPYFVSWQNVHFNEMEDSFQLIQNQNRPSDSRFMMKQTKLSLHLMH
jgi:hypothetical protein